MTHICNTKFTRLFITRWSSEGSKSKIDFRLCNEGFVFCFRGFSLLDSSDGTLGQFSTFKSRYYFQRIHISLPFDKFYSFDHFPLLILMKSYFHVRFSINDFPHESGSFIDAILWECQRWSTRLRFQIKDTWPGLLYNSYRSLYLHNMINVLSRTTLYYIKVT